MPRYRSPPERRPPCSNAYFFALAAVAWFLNAWLFMVATLWVSLVLYRRAFRSKFLSILEE